MLAIIHADLVMPDHIIPDGFVQTAILPILEE